MLGSIIYLEIELICEINYFSLNNYCALYDYRMLWNDILTIISTPIVWHQLLDLTLLLHLPNLLGRMVANVATERSSSQV